VTTLKTKLYLPRLALVFIGLFVAACGGAPAQDQNPTESVASGATSETTTTETTGGNTTGTAEATAAMGEMDQMFIDMMVPHHQSAIEMGQIALERAEHPELKTMAEEMIGKQQEEQTQLRDCRTEWYGSPDTPPMSAIPMMPGMTNADGMEMPVMDATESIEALRSAPEPFDLAFIDTIIPHHTMAIEAAQMVIDQGEHPELKEMAQQMIDDQQKEITQLQTWRETWYPDAAGTSP
jgi:uncharacterized protein (DUF305 family)